MVDEYCLFDVAKWAHEDNMRITLMLGNLTSSAVSFTKKRKLNKKKNKTGVDLPDCRNIDTDSSDGERETNATKSPEPAPEGPTQVREYDEENKLFQSRIEQEQKRLGECKFLKNSLLISKVWIDVKLLPC